MPIDSSHYIVPDSFCTATDAILGTSGMGLTKMASPPASTVKKASPGIPRQIKYIDMEAVWDVKILCGDIEFRAHKAFLCRESDFFLKALAGNFMVS